MLCGQLRRTLQQLLISRAIECGGAACVLRLQSHTLVTSAGHRSFASQLQETGQKSLWSLSGILVRAPPPICISESLFHVIQMSRAVLYHAGSSPAAPMPVGRRLTMRFYSTLTCVLLALCKYLQTSWCGCSPVTAYGRAGGAPVLCSLFEICEITSARAFLGRFWLPSLCSQALPDEAQPYPGPLTAASINEQ